MVINTRSRFKVGETVNGLVENEKVIHGTIIETGRVFYSRRNDMYLDEDIAKELKVNFLSKPNFFMLDGAMYKAVDVYCVIEAADKIHHRMMQDDIRRA